MEQMKWLDTRSPNLNDFSEAELHQCLALINRYGEIRFRYAACLTEHMVRYNSSGQWLLTIQSALKGNWMSSMGAELLAELGLRDTDELGEHFSIPWLNRYSELAKTEPAFCQVVSTASMRCVYDRRRVFAFLDEDEGTWTSADNWHNDVLFSGLAKASLRFVPDLQFENVVLWLQYLVDGGRDPQLRRSFDKYRPDLHTEDFPQIKAAFINLISNEDTDELDDSQDDLNAKFLPTDGGSF